MFSKKIFGRRLLEARKLNRKTQADLAALLDISKSRISEMENGKTTTTIENFALICKYYHVSADYLLGLSDNPRPACTTSSHCLEEERSLIMEALSNVSISELSLEEFQDFTETHDGNWELKEGIPVKMDSGSDAHQWLCGQLTLQFMSYFTGKSCAALPEKDMWASTEELTSTRDKRKDATRKPDLLVYCSKEQSVQNVIVRPQLVAEVWSPGNSNAERSVKQALYQALGVKELWLIDSVTREFTILSFADLQIPQVRIGRLEEDKLCSFIFPELSVDLSGLGAFLENFSNP